MNKYPYKLPSRTFRGVKIVKYRIVTDRWAGYKALKWRIWFPFWVGLSQINVFESVFSAVEYIHKDHNRMYGGKIILESE